jgi:hypothetical protein
MYPKLSVLLNNVDLEERHSSLHTNSPNMINKSVVDSGPVREGKMILQAFVGDIKEENKN